MLELLLIIDWNHCNDFIDKEGKHVAIPFRYLGLRNTALNDKIYPIKVVRDLDIPILKAMSKVVILGEREYPKYNQKKK